MKLTGNLPPEKIEAAQKEVKESTNPIKVFNRASDTVNRFFFNRWTLGFLLFMVIYGLIRDFSR